MALLNVAVERTVDTSLGLHLAEHAQLGSFDVHFYAMASSPTLGVPKTTHHVPAWKAVLAEMVGS